MELMALAQGNTTQAGVMGTLVRQYDNLAFKQEKNGDPVYRHYRPGFRNGISNTANRLSQLDSAVL